MSSERRFSVHPFPDSVLKEVLVLKNSCVGTQLTEYNRLYKENSAILPRCMQPFRAFRQHLLDSLHPAHRRSAHHAERYLRRALPAPGRPSTHRSKSWNARAYSRSPAKAGGTASPSATPRGLELAEKTVDRVIESEQKALLDLSPDEQKQLLDAMRRYNAMLNTRMHDILFVQEDIHE